MEAIEGGMSIRQASLAYNLPKSTLSDRINGKHAGVYGSVPILSKAIECKLKDILLHMIDIGFSLKKQEVIEVVRNYLKTKNQSHFFKDGKPSDKWYYGFMNRYKDQLSFRKVGNMPANRAMSTPDSAIDTWFAEVAQLYNDHDFHHKPYHIFNCDETGLQTNINTAKVITRKGSKNPKRLANSNEKIMYTVSVCGSAAGEYLPVHTINKDKRNMSDWVLGGPSKSTWDTSESGWMELEQFLRWFEKVFLKNVEHLDWWKLLFLDGHASHISLELINPALENKVHLMTLPPHSSHLLQPMDVSVFRAVKEKWRQVLLEFLRANDFIDVTKSSFPGLLKKVAEEGLSSTNLISGFNASCLYPIDRSKISENKLEIGSYWSNNNDDIPSA